MDSKVFKLLMWIFVGVPIISIVIIGIIFVLIALFGLPDIFPPDIVTSLINGMSL